MILIKMIIIILLEKFKKIFNDLPEINVEILKMHISESTSIIITELIVHINENGLIINIKAST